MLHHVVGAVGWGVEGFDGRGPHLRRSANAVKKSEVKDVDGLSRTGPN